MLRLLLMIGVTLLIGGCAAPRGEVRASIGAIEAVGQGADAGFERAFEPKPFVFPQDHGPHPGYAVEWWYFTGNLDAGGRHFGYQLTFFRTGLAPSPPKRASAWGASNIYMAHLALSDVEGGRFYAYERFSRDGAGLAGASGEPFRVFLEDWFAEGDDPGGMTMRLHASQEDVALDLTLASTKPVVLQGDQGLSQKGSEPGNASYYYSLTRMATAGSISVAGQRYPVAGLSWMDREWGTSYLERGATGWDWLSAQLDDGRELMVFQIRGEADPGTPDRVVTRFGTVTAPDGATQRLDPSAISLEALGTWRSPASGTLYPSGWRLTLADIGLALELQPYLKDQELRLTVAYWEGAVRISGAGRDGPVGGNGYVELTGYGD